MHNVDWRYTRTGTRHGHAALTYVQWFMDRVPFRGHWQPGMATTGPHRVPRLGCEPGGCGPPYSFEYARNASHTEPLLQLLRDVVLAMRPAPTHIVLGAPWPGIVNGATWLEAARVEALLAFGDEVMATSPTQFVWKEHTLPSPCGIWRKPVVEGLELRNYGALVGAHPKWLYFNLHNVTAGFGAECYNDDFHFNELARTHFNELLLRQLKRAGGVGAGVRGWNEPARNESTRKTSRSEK